MISNRQRYSYQYDETHGRAKRFDSIHSLRSYVVRTSYVVVDRCAAKLRCGQLLLVVGIPTSGQMCRKQIYPEFASKFDSKRHLSPEPNIVGYP